MFRPGSIVAGALTQANGKIKNRPLLLLAPMPYAGDWLVCGISSQLHLFKERFDEFIDEKDPEFPRSGLKHPGIIRTGFVGVLPERHFPGVLGGLNESRARNILDRLLAYLHGQRGVI